MPRIANRPISTINVIIQMVNYLCHLIINNAQSLSIYMQSFHSELAVDGEGYADDNNDDEKEDQDEEDEEDEEEGRRRRRR